MVKNNPKQLLGKRKKLFNSLLLLESKKKILVKMIKDINKELNSLDLYILYEMEGL